MPTRLVIAAVLAVTVLAASGAAPALADEDGVLIRLPYRSQIDDSPYARANCGPASLAMVL